MKTFFKIFTAFFVIFLSQNLPAETMRDLEPVPLDRNKRIKQLKIKSLADLQELTPYDSVSVIQKRYLPKTFRGELNVSFSAVINHTFFYLGGVSTHAGFFIREDHGFGLEGFAFFPPINKRVTNDMIGNRILPYTAVLSQLYGGIYYKWTPVFGKFAMLNRKIIYFDMYATIGFGASRMISGLDQKKQELLGLEEDFFSLSRQVYPAGSVGLGQIFALNQNWALNWELKWFYTIVQFKNQEGLYTPVDINFSLGMNYYFPGAGYR